MTDPFMSLPLLLQAELRQRREEGCDVTAFESQVAGVDETTPAAEIIALYDALGALERDPDFPYREPSQLKAIQRERPNGPRRLPLHLPDGELEDRLLGAWLQHARISGRL